MNEHASRDAKLVWIILLVLLNMFVLPVYWYMHIWREPASAA